MVMFTQQRGEQTTSVIYKTMLILGDKNPGVYTRKVSTSKKFLSDNEERPHAH
jgi:hypothetical protein